MATVADITSAYTNCLNEVYLFLNKKGYEIVYPTIKFSSDKTAVSVYCVEPLYFQRWPYRPTAAKSEKVDIVAEVCETIRLVDGLCTHSALRLNYFGCKGDDRFVCDAIHYDFNVEVQDRHPVCHAQATNSILDALPEAFPSKPDVGAIAGRHQAIRIPTAFVNLAGLFAKVVADHCPPQIVGEFWDTCKVYLERIPDHAESPTSKALINAKSLRSYWWYKW